MLNEVRKATRQTHKPFDKDWEAVTRILNYPKGSRDLGIIFICRDAPRETHASADSFCAPRVDDGLLISDRKVMYCGVPIT